MFLKCFVFSFEIEEVLMTAVLFPEVKRLKTYMQLLVKFPDIKPSYLTDIFLA
jgi:hypothetical protein